MDLEGFSKGIIHPWQKDHYDQICRCTSSNVPHNWLFCGRSGIGKQDFVRYFATWLLCNQRNKGMKGPCGACQSCRWLDLGEHPGLFFSNANDRLTVDEIRHLNHSLQSNDLNASPKVAIILGVDYLSRSVANALLKTLEEPQVNAFFLLTAVRAQNVLPTVSSRSLIVQMPEPSETLGDTNAMDPMLASLGMPVLLAKEWIASGFWQHVNTLLQPFFVLGKYNSQDLKQSASIFNEYSKESLYLIYAWLGVGIAKYHKHNNRDFLQYYQPIYDFIEKFGGHTIGLFVSTVLKLAHDLQSIPGINKQLLFESLVYRWQLGDVDERCSS